MWRRWFCFPKGVVDSRKVKVDFSLEDMDLAEFNLPRSEKAKQVKCTLEKEEAIMQAFKHFGII